MASKRKSKAPSRLTEEKRQCIAWNMYDVTQICEESSDYSSSITLSSEKLSESFRDPAIDRSLEQKDDLPPHQISSNKAADVLQSLPWLTIPLDCTSSDGSMEIKLNKSDEGKGLKLFRVLLIREKVIGKTSFDADDRGYSNIIECLNISKWLEVRIFENPLSKNDRYGAEIYFKGKNQSTGQSNGSIWNCDPTKRYYDICMWKGIFVLPKPLLLNIDQMVKSQQLKLQIDLHDFCNDELEMYGCIIEGKHGTPAFDDSFVNKRNHKMQMGLIMNYFYGIQEEKTDVIDKSLFPFTASEIPTLYDSIKNYHSKRFDIRLTDSVIAVECDDRSSSSSDELSNAQTLEQYSSPEGTPSRSNYKTEETDDSNFCHEDVHVNMNDDIYEIVGDSQMLTVSKGNLFGIEVDMLIPKLRKYQYAAVQWMISRENETEYEQGPEEHFLWTSFQGMDNKRMYYNKFTGRVCSKLQICPLPYGGILADEMGLGKTVEVLALILQNQRETRFSFQNSFQNEPKVIEDEASDLLCCFCAKNANKNWRCCFDCGVRMHFKCAGTKGKEINRYYCPLCGTKELIKTHCTLIISPETIVYQWMEEIQNHVQTGALKYMLYLGVGRGGYIQPMILADYDVIITTYETLNAEFYHVETEQGRERKLRHRKRYVPLPSPLIYLEFWRVCLDEAQMIQCTTTKLAQMALRINAVHRWCVTGTPLQRGLEDIYGMLLFIGVYPYGMKTWWNKLICQPLIRGDSKPLLDILARVMWRTEKKDVLDQINLPKQSESMKLLKFTPVEWQFYKRQEEFCTANALKEIDKWKEKETILSSLSKSTLHSLLAPLLRLRQACCHPRAVRDGVLGIHKSHLTMEKLLEGLKVKTKLECEDALRQLMCAINGLAAVDIIEEKFPDAITKYREAMQLSSAHKEIIRTDLLQKLHTVKNLAFALTKTTCCSHALSDDNLETEAKELGKEYMKKSDVQVEAAIEKLESVERNLIPVNGSIDWKNPWWMHMLNIVKSDSNVEKEVITKVKSELQSQLNASTFMENRFSNTDGLQYLMVSKITSLTDLREDLKKALVALKREPTREMVLESADCCLRNAGQKKQENRQYRCEFCKADDFFTDYENMLFSHRGMKTNGPVEAEDAKRFGGLRAETELDVVLKTLLSISRQHVMKDGIITEAKAHINFMDLLKQEFKALRNLWFALHQRISALDELEMSSIRLRLRYENEDNKQSYIIHWHEIPAQRLKLMGDKTAASHLLKKKKGQLFYLTNLEKAQNQLQSSNPETCPICEEALGVEWAVFSCGHCFCCPCTTRLEQRFTGHAKRGGLKLHCPMCRDPTFSEEISFVVMCDHIDPEQADIEVKGSYSVKIEAVVRKILEIGQRDPDGKIIVFSTWQDVLSIISDALTVNNVSFNYGVGSKQKFLTSLTSFKTDPAIKALLLPLKLGSKGLNIIEATHVILVEPTLNPANELQAVGRVHRIGQTKPTFVHRFVVRDTVEERIRDLLKTKPASEVLSNNDASSSLTIGDLSSLLV